MSDDYLRLREAYDDVWQASDRLAVPIHDTGTLEDATALLAALWHAAEEHGVSRDDLNSVADLPMACLDVTAMLERRRAR